MQTSRSKSKSDSQHNNDGVIDRLLFTRYTVIETDASANEVLEALRLIKQPDKNIGSLIAAFFVGSRQLESSLDSGGNVFKMKINKIVRGTYTVAITNGQIVYSDGYEKTLVHLKTRYSLLTSLFFIGTTIFCMVFFVQLMAVILGINEVNSIEDIAFLCVMVCFYGLFSYIQYADRQWLINSIYEAIHNFPEDSASINHDSYDEIEVYEDETMDNLYMDNA